MWKLRRSTSVTRTFQWIFTRERINAVIVEGDAFHRYDRAEMKSRMADAAKGVAAPADGEL